MPNILEEIERSLSESSKEFRIAERGNLVESEEHLALAHADFAASVKENREMTEIRVDLLQIIFLYAVYAFSAILVFFLILMIFNCWSGKRTVVVVPSI